MKTFRVNCGPFVTFSVKANTEEEAIDRALEIVKGWSGPVGAQVWWDTTSSETVNMSICPEKISRDMLEVE